MGCSGCQDLVSPVRVWREDGRETQSETEKILQGMGIPQDLPRRIAVYSVVGCVGGRASREPEALRFAGCVRGRRDSRVF